MTAGAPLRPRGRTARRTAFGMTWASRAGAVSLLCGLVLMAGQAGRPAGDVASGATGASGAPADDVVSTGGVEPGLPPAPEPLTTAAGPASNAIATAAAQPAAPRTTRPAPGVASSGTTPGGTSVIAGDGRRIGGCLSARGIPSCGAFLGAAIGGNADPRSRESQFGDQLGLHRTYYRAGQVAAAVRTARADIAAGRVPWISFKPGYSWGEMASGRGDAWAKDLAQRLSRAGGPVWLAIHHEPENDGDIRQWTRMQARLAPIVRRAAPNVAYSIITTGWNQTYVPRSPYLLEKIWPKTTIDIVAFDPYNEYGVSKHGRKRITTFSELKPYYAVLASFAATKGIHWAIGETGYTDAAAAKDPAWLQRSYSDLVAMGGIGLSYFDSSLNAIGDSDWPLDTPAKIAAFRSALRTSIELAP